MNIIYVIENIYIFFILFYFWDNYIFYLEEIYFFLNLYLKVLLFFN